MELNYLSIRYFVNFVIIKIHKMLLANLFLSSLGPGEILLIGLVVLLMFGGKKIPELMKGLGQGIREFNKAKNNIESEVKESMREIEK